MKILSVYFHGGEGEPINIGRLAAHQHKCHLELSSEFVASGMNLSPFMLKPTTELQEAQPTPFNGLHGVFNDSLPDGWGLILMDRAFKQHGIDTASITPVDRLAYMGDRAMGALSYKPDDGKQFFEDADDELDLDALATESVRLYEGEIEEVMDCLAINGTPSGGARPKVLLGLNGNKVIAGAGDLPDGFGHWLAKFPTGTSADKKSEGAIEFIYSNMARQAGVDFSKTRLVPGTEDNDYFVTNRFDRDDGNKRIHVHSLAGLINADFRVPDCDYETLIKVCSHLTKSHEETSQLFRRMLFNIMSGNRDDHSKNFAFLMDAKGVWKNTPAYDVTYNLGMNGEHTMDVSGVGKNITLDHIMPIAKLASVSKKDVKHMIDEVSSALSQWDQEAKNYNIPKTQLTDISKHIQGQRKLLVPA